MKKKYIYPERESKSLEFKSQPPKFINLIKTCVAFANGIGGQIIIGIENDTREIVGISEKTRERIYSEFPNSLYDTTSPGLLVEIYEKRFNDESVMIIDVPFSFRKPVFIKNEGIPDGVYLRAGPNTRKANPEYIDELMRENKRIVFDEETINANLGILSEEMLKSIYNVHDKEKLLSEKLINRGSTNTQLYPTVAGVLMFCDTPHSYIPEAIIQCTRFHGTSGRDIIQSEEIKGSLVKQAQISFELIKSWLTREYQLFGVKLKGKMILPEIALREAIINALIHRKYWIAGATKIALFDNRLEIFNPGNFPGLFDLNRLGDGTTYLRNPNLARVARRFGLVEKLGTGIRVILESCQEAGLQKPEYIEGADSIKVIFHFLPAEDKFSTDNAKLLALFNMRGEIKLGEVEKYLNVSRNTATRKLNQMIESGKIIRQGKGPAVKYILIKK
ncbi:MAG: hypothetical protein A3F14_00560 [Gammaproteobacteria bacterium RIFCSPHIGHO2_12_FULL_43_28]|nr:MAG: hypothetical protein A3F14_00560 [Gammaproteobacteria bacterium RIFCSPHIGHO2_12_FULL_43_28]